MQQRQFVTLPPRSGLTCAVEARMIFTFCVFVLGFLSSFSNLPVDILDGGRQCRESRFGLQRYQDVISSGGSGGRRLNASERKRQLVPLQGEDNMFYCANTAAQPQRSWTRRSYCKETTRGGCSSNILRQHSAVCIFGYIFCMFCVTHKSQR